MTRNRPASESGRGRGQGGPYPRSQGQPQAVEETTPLGRGQGGPYPRSQSQPLSVVSYVPLNWRQGKPYLRVDYSQNVVDGLCPTSPSQVALHICRSDTSLESAPTIETQDYSDLEGPSCDASENEHLYSLDASYEQLSPVPGAGSFIPRRRWDDSTFERMQKEGYVTYGGGDDDENSNNNGSNITENVKTSSLGTQRMLSPPPTYRRRYNPNKGTEDDGNSSYDGSEPDIDESFKTLSLGTQKFAAPLLTPGGRYNPKTRIKRNVKVLGGGNIEASNTSENNFSGGEDGKQDPKRVLIVKMKYSAKSAQPFEGKTTGKPQGKRS